MKHILALRDRTTKSISSKSKLQKTQLKQDFSNGLPKSQNDKECIRKLENYINTTQPKEK